MGKAIDRAVWGVHAETVFVEIEQWRREHPAATFDEIEDAVEERIQRLRTHLLTDTIHTSARTEVAADGVRQICPTCGGGLQAKGTARRTVLTHRGGEVDVTRSYGTCPRCQAGVFSPGPRTGTASE